MTEEKLELLQSLLNESKFEEVIKIASEEIDNLSVLAILLGFRGIAKCQLGEFCGAIEDLSSAISIRPNFPEAFHWRGQARNSLNDSLGDIADQTEAIILNPYYTEAYFRRGRQHVNHNNSRDAIHDFSKVIECDPNNSLAYHYRGIAKSGIGYHLDAILDFNKSIELNPMDSEAYYHLGRSEFILGLYDEAIKNNSIAIDLDPKNFDAFLNRANAYFSLKKYENAIDDYNSIFEIDPEFTSIYIMRGQVFLKMCDLDSARKNLDKGLGLLLKQFADYNSSRYAFDFFIEFLEILEDELPDLFEKYLKEFKDYLEEELADFVNDPQPSPSGIHKYRLYLGEFTEKYGSSEDALEHYLAAYEVIKNYVIFGDQKVQRKKTFEIILRCFWLHLRENDNEKAAEFLKGNDYHSEGFDLLELCNESFLALNKSDSAEISSTLDALIDSFLGESAWVEFRLNNYFKMPFKMLIEQFLKHDDLNWKISLKILFFSAIFQNRIQENIQIITKKMLELNPEKVNEIMKEIRQPQEEIQHGEDTTNDGMRCGQEVDVPELDYNNLQKIIDQLPEDARRLFLQDNSYKLQRFVSGMKEFFESAIEKNLYPLIINYYLTDGTYVAILIPLWDPRKTKVFSLDDATEKTIKTMSQNYLNIEKDDDKKIREDRFFEEMYSILFKPFIGYINDLEEEFESKGVSSEIMLMLAASNELSNLPLHAAMNDDGNDIIDKYPITYLPSLLAFCYYTAEKEKLTAKAVFGVNETSRDTSMKEELKVLEKKGFSNPNKKDLSPQAVIDDLKENKYGRIHFIGHGNINQSNPLYSYINIGDDDEKDMNKNKLFLINLVYYFDADLRNTELIHFSNCLSSCRVDFSKVLNESISVAEGFMIKTGGRGNCIAPIVSVHNKIAIAFTRAINEVESNIPMCKQFQLAYKIVRNNSNKGKIFENDRIFVKEMKILNQKHSYKLIGLGL